MTNTNWNKNTTVDALRRGTRFIPSGFIKFDPKNIIGAYPENLFECYVDKEKPIAIFYTGKQSKPTWFIRFTDNDAMKKRVVNSISRLMTWEDRKAERREARKNVTKDIKVGQIYSYSWGYEQTNVDFYQVTEVKGKVFTIREISRKIVSNDCGNSMTADVSPVKDSFLEDSKPIIKRSLSMPHGILSLTDENKKHFTSWYA